MQYNADNILEPVAFLTPPAKPHLSGTFFKPNDLQPMKISERTSKIVWGECAARCCICKRNVLYKQDGKVESLVGEVAHIVGETSSAARGQSALSPKDRSNSNNLLLLCREHHKIVDDDPVHYSVENLSKIKDEHLTWITERLVIHEKWRSNISQLTYINVPRLCEQAELHGIHVDLRHYKENQTLHSLRWDLNYVMASFRSVLARIAIDAVPLLSVILHESVIGTPIAFDRQRFRTKNVPMNMDGPENDCRFTSDLKKDPHIYVQLDSLRVVIYIDPRWITTSTAFTLFRPSSGQATFSGLGRITSVDYETRIMTVTPWVVGLPANLFERALPSVVNSSEIHSVNNELDALVEMEKARAVNMHFSPSPTECDLCNQNLDGGKYMIDGAVKELGTWACMCASCFATRGVKIQWGYGQLYLREKKGWLAVAGFSPNSYDD